jgi:hypothetical protein
MSLIPELAEDPSQIVSIKIAFDTTQLTMLRAQREKLSDQIEIYGNMGQLAHKGRIPATVDEVTCTERIEQLLRERATLDQRIEQAYEEIARNPRGTGHAFVTFINCSLAQKCIQQHQKNYRNFLSIAACFLPDVMGQNPAAWTIVFAPAPGDIIWVNLGHPCVNLLTRLVVSNILLFLLLAFVSVPSLILNQVDQIIKETTSSLSGTPLMIIGFVSKYFTTLLAYGINSMWMPNLMQRSVDFEKHFTISEEQETLFLKKTIFLFVNMMLLPILALGTVDELTLDGSTSWDDIFGNEYIASTGFFFLHYLVHATLTGSAMALLDLPNYVWRRWKIATATTQRELDEANKPPIYAPSGSYAGHLTIFGILLMYSVMVPLILAFGLAYFLSAFLLDRYTLRIRPCMRLHNTGGLPFAVSRHLLLYISWFQFSLATYFFIRGSETRSYIIGGFVLSFLAVSTFAFYLFRQRNSPLTNLFSTLHIPCTLFESKAHGGDFLVPEALSSGYVDPLLLREGMELRS